MSIKVRDILQFLDGNSSSETIKDLQTWAYDDLKNAQDLAVYQAIYNELAGLRDYRKVDVEWSSLVGGQQASAEVVDLIEAKDVEKVTDLDVLRYIDGRSDNRNKQKIQTWAANSVSNQKDLYAMEEISKESKGLSDYRLVSADAEWKLFSKSLQSSTPVIALQPQQKAYEENERRLIPAWFKYAAAAAILLLGVAMVWRVSSASSDLETLTFATLDVPDDIEISDGTIIHLKENSKITYFANYKKVKERKVELVGQAEFQIVNIENMPFEVITSDQIGIKVLGTTFSVENNEDFIKVVNNIEGKVKVYALVDTAVNVIVDSGECFGYTGAKFLKIEAIEENSNAKNYDVLFVLDFLMETSGWKVISSPYTEFDGEDMILIDLDQPYEEILEDLVKRADFSYKKLTCDGCYIVDRFQGQE
jgi:ferric-dicitrate binding protein FerR (iron transport regulator)